MSEAFSTGLYLKSKLFISFACESTESIENGNIFVGGLGIEVKMIHSHPHAGP